MEHPKAKGDMSTLAIMYGLRENGYDLLVPFGENTRYDLVLDDCGAFRVSSARQDACGTARSNSTR
jgi:hypothetical protein